MEWTKPCMWGLTFGSTAADSGNMAGRVRGDCETPAWDEDAHGCAASNSVRSAGECNVLKTTVSITVMARGIVQ